MAFSRESATHAALRLSPGLFFLVLAGCTVGPNYKRPAAPVAATWDVSPPWREAEPRDEVPKTEWWSLFRDHDLNGLETELLTSNQTLAGSVATLEQARATAQVQNATLFPTVTVNPSVTGQRYSANRSTGSNIPLTNAIQGSYIIPFNVSYEVDLVGKRRRP